MSGFNIALELKSTFLDLTASNSRFLVAVYGYALLTGARFYCGVISLSTLN